MSIILRNVEKELGDPPLRILKNISLEISDSDYIALTGRSGSGKSTLLYILSSLDFPTRGTIEIDGKNINQLSTQEIHLFRNKNMGFIFQFHYLLPELSSLENILMPAAKLHQVNAYRKRALELLDLVGLSDKGNRLPRQLSGGEQQRVAIARALIMRPRFLFADEPTGSLDTANGEMVMNLIAKANEQDRTTIVLVTHEPSYANRAHRKVQLKDGEIVSTE